MYEDEDDVNDDRQDALDPSALATSLAAGLIGAVVLTAVHETTRRITPRAPRMDILGERALAKMFRRAGAAPPPREPALHRMALGGDLVSNSLYYALVGAGPDAWLRGLALGLAAGVGAVALPPRMGLGRSPRGLTPRVKGMTIGYYALGGLAAAAASHLLSSQRQRVA